MRRTGTRGFDEASSRAAGVRNGLRALAPGGVCTAVGYYLATGTRVPLMRMYANDATLRLGVSHARAILPDLLAFVARSGFEAERVTTLDAGWDEAPTPTPQGPARSSSTATRSTPPSRDRPSPPIPPRIAA